MTEPAAIDIRVGIGFDAHGLAAGRRLMLGGVEVPHDRGLVGHSDGDVLSHAIMDALLGAGDLGDKGTHFPSEDPQYKDISSLVLLTKVAGLLDAQRWRVSNVDATMLAQKPRLAPFLPAMKELICEALAITPGQVSIKVTTTDYMGFIGREEGIAAWAVAAIVKMP